ncbi:MAG: PA2778 family cysteine peptidase [Gammaproteobacteria bacterium]|nr:PA2778 family cysteine peptidase [Gammaproteobacteria bacterium]
MWLQIKAVCLRTGGLLAILLLAGCAATPQSDALVDRIEAPFAKPTELSQTPFFPQEEYQCGPAALATVLQAQGVNVTPEELKDQVYLPERKGSLQIEMITATRRHKLLPYVLRPQLSDVLAEINAGRPVLVLQNEGVSWYPQWHYAVIIGYNLQEGKLILRSGTIKRYVMSMFTFERTWQRSQSWAMVTLKPGELPVRPDEWHYVQAVVGFEQTHDWSLIETFYLTGLQQWPDSRDLHMGYGNVLYLQHQRKAAAEQYRLVLQLTPDFAPAHNNLAMVLAELGDYRPALVHVRRAIELGGVHSEEYQATLQQIHQMQAAAKKH